MNETGIDWHLWLFTMVPLVFSAGPGNIMVAASGARSGLRRSLWFIYGLDGTYFLLAIAVGLGLGQVLQTNLLISSIVKTVGTIYIFYLAYRFLRASAPQTGTTQAAFRFQDGIVVQLTNTKGIIMLVVMFSEFFVPSVDMFADIITMSAVLVILNFSAHILWASFGIVMQNALVRSPVLFQAQNYLFATMMFSVGIWLILR